MGWPKMKITQLADQVRNIPLREVLERDLVSRNWTVGILVF